MVRGPTPFQFYTSVAFCAEEKGKSVMPQTHTALLKELHGVSDSFSRLGEKLAAVASELQVAGMPPKPHLLDELRASRTTFEELRQRATELAGNLADSRARQTEEIESLADLKALIQSLGEAQEKRAEDEKISHQALVLLDRVLAIEHCEEVDFPPLADCQVKARELRRAIPALRWPDVHPEAAPLAHRRHPLAELLTLVERHMDLDDDLWLLLKHAVSESFGRKLSLAAARGKLFVSERTEPEQEPRQARDHAGSELAEDDGELAREESEPSEDRL